MQGFYAVTDFQLKGTLKGTVTPVVIDGSIMEYIFLGVEYALGKITAAAEYYTNILDSCVHTSDNILLIPESTIETQGYYISISYRLNDNFEFGTYYSDYKNDKDGSGSSNELNDICISARFDLSTNWLCKLECHKMEGLFGVLPESDGTMDKNWYLYSAKLTYSF